MGSFVNNLGFIGGATGQYVRSRQERGDSVDDINADLRALEKAQSKRSSRSSATRVSSSQSKSRFKNTQTNTAKRRTRLTPFGPNNLAGIIGNVEAREKARNAEKTPRSGSDGSSENDIGNNLQGKERLLTVEEKKQLEKERSERQNDPAKSGRGPEKGDNNLREENSDTVAGDNDDVKDGQNQQNENTDQEADGEDGGNEGGGGNGNGNEAEIPDSGRRRGGKPCLCGCLGVIQIFDWDFVGVKFMLSVPEVSGRFGRTTRAFVEQFSLLREDPDGEQDYYEKFETDFFDCQGIYPEQAFEFMDLGDYGGYYFEGNLSTTHRRDRQSGYMTSTDFTNQAIGYYTINNIPYDSFTFSKSLTEWFDLYDAVAQDLPDIDCPRDASRPEVIGNEVDVWRIDPFWPQDDSSSENTNTSCVNFEDLRMNQALLKWTGKMGYIRGAIRLDQVPDDEDFYGRGRTLHDEGNETYYDWLVGPVGRNETVSFSWVDKIGYRKNNSKINEAVISSFFEDTSSATWKDIYGGTLNFDSAYNGQATAIHDVNNRFFKEKKTFDSRWLIDEIKPHPQNAMGSFRIESSESEADSYFIPGTYHSVSMSRSGMLAVAYEYESNIGIALSGNHGQTWNDYKEVLLLKSNEYVSKPYLVRDEKEENLYLFFILQDSYLCMKQIPIHHFVDEPHDGRVPKIAEFTSSFNIYDFAKDNNLGDAKSVILSNASYIICGGPNKCWDLEGELEVNESRNGKPTRFEYVEPEGDSDEEKDKFKINMVHDMTNFSFGAIRMSSGHFVVMYCCPNEYDYTGPYRDEHPHVRLIISGDGERWDILRRRIIIASQSEKPEEDPDKRTKEYTRERFGEVIDRYANVWTNEQNLSTDKDEAPYFTIKNDRKLNLNLKYHWQNGQIICTYIYQGSLFVRRFTAGEIIQLYQTDREGDPTQGAFNIYRHSWEISQDRKLITENMNKPVYIAGSEPNDSISGFVTYGELKPIMTGVAQDFQPDCYITDNGHIKVFYYDRNLSVQNITLEPGRLSPVVMGKEYIEKGIPDEEREYIIPDASPDFIEIEMEWPPDEPKGIGEDENDFLLVDKNYHNVFIITEVGDDFISRGLNHCTGRSYRYVNWLDQSDVWSEDAGDGFAYNGSARKEKVLYNWKRAFYENNFEDLAIYIGLIGYNAGGRLKYSFRYPTSDGGMETLEDVVGPPDISDVQQRVVRMPNVDIKEDVNYQQYKENSLTNTGNLFKFIEVSYNADDNKIEIKNKGQIVSEIELEDTN